MNSKAVDENGRRGDIVTVDGLVNAFNNIGQALGRGGGIWIGDTSVTYVSRIIKKIKTITFGTNIKEFYRASRDTNLIFNKLTADQQHTVISKILSRELVERNGYSLTNIYDMAGDHDAGRISGYRVENGKYKFKVDSTSPTRLNPKKLINEGYLKIEEQYLNDQLIGYDIIEFTFNVNHVSYEWDARFDPEDGSNHVYGTVTYTVEHVEKTYFYSKA